MVLLIEDWGDHHLLYLNNELAFVVVKVNVGYILFGKDSRQIIGSAEEGLGSVVISLVQRFGAVTIERK